MSCYLENCIVIHQLIHVIPRCNLALARYRNKHLPNVLLNIIRPEVVFVMQN